MRDSKRKAYPGSLILVIAALLIFCVSQSHAAESAQGREGQRADGSYISTAVNGELFSYTLSFDELAEDASAALVAIIDADGEFQAAVKSTAPPGQFEDDDVTFTVLTEGGLEVTSIVSCETDANYTSSGVYLFTGRAQAAIRKPTAVAGNGVFDLRFSMLSAPDVHLPFSTGGGPGRDLSGLLNAITSALESLGFDVDDVGSELLISKPNDYFRSARVESTDTAITHTCAGLGGSSPPLTSTPTNVPTLSQYGLMLMALVLLLTGIVMIWRRSAAAD